MHSLAAQVAVEEGGHIIVQRVHQLGNPLQNRDLHSHLRQIFRHLQADEAPAGQHRGFGPVPLHKRPNPERVLHRPQGKQPGTVQPRQRGAGGGGPRGQEKLVIALHRNLPRL